MNRVAGFLMNTRIHGGSRIKNVDLLLEGVLVPEGGRALELGCGAGFSSAHLASMYGLEVTGTDVEKAKVEAAARKNRGVRGVSFVVADAASLPFGDATFDLVLSQNVFHHVPDWRAAAAECARVMRPGGLFLFSDITGPGVMRLVTRVGKDHGFHELDELITLFESRGFRVEKRAEPAGRLHKEFSILFRRG